MATAAKSPEKGMKEAINPEKEQQVSRQQCHPADHRLLRMLRAPLMVLPWPTK